MDVSSHTVADAKAAWRTHAMFKAMSSDYLLREQFATDPMQIFCDYVLTDRASKFEADSANQLIFSVFSSPPLRRWMGAYSRRLGGKSPSRHSFVSQFAGAIAESRDSLVALALMRDAAAGQNLFEFQTDFFRAVLTSMGRGFTASGTEMSPGTATDMSPGTATDMSPGTASFGLTERLASELASAIRFSTEILRLETAGTEMSPGGGTEMSPGGGTEMSPGALRLTQALTSALQRAKRFSELLLRAEAGTEMSPGTGTATEMSPGTATEMSPGALQLNERLAEEINVAARLASNLLQAAGGTEMSPGGGTEMSPGGGTEMSPGTVGSAEALVASLRRAQLFLGDIRRVEEGTEMSPGRGTEVSPGGGTEVSPGQVPDGQWGVQLPTFVVVALGALIQYAVVLRRQGALTVSGLEAE
jgi:hypothetical protein